MKSIKQLQEEIAEYDNIKLGAAQVLGNDWHYEIKDSTQGEIVCFIEYTGPRVSRQC
jgi:hypothetical protein